MISAIAGLVVGLLHVFSGPDHLAAIAPLAVNVRRRAWQTGLRWGIGHSSGVLVIGLFSLFLQDLLPLENISNWSERAVGVILIAIGFWGIRKAMQVHAHEHEHNGERHIHLHIHTVGEAHPEIQAHAHRHAAFGIGTVHGLAGSSHFLGVLPAVAFANTTDGVIYLIAFGLGTIVAMSFFSGALSTFAARLIPQTASNYRNLMCCCSTLTLLVGAYWLFD